MARAKAIMRAATGGLLAVGLLAGCSEGRESFPDHYNQNTATTTPGTRLPVVGEAERTIVDHTNTATALLVGCLISSERADSTTQGDVHGNGSAPVIGLDGKYGTADDRKIEYRIARDLSRGQITLSVSNVQGNKRVTSVVNVDPSNSVMTHHEIPPLDATRQAGKDAYYGGSESAQVVNGNYIRNVTRHQGGNSEWNISDPRTGQTAPADAGILDSWQRAAAVTLHQIVSEAGVNLNGCFPPFSERPNIMPDVTTYSPAAPTPGHSPNPGELVVTG